MRYVTHYRCKAGVFLTVRVRRWWLPFTWRQETWWCEDPTNYLRHSETWDSWRREQDGEMVTRGKSLTLTALVLINEARTQQTEELLSA